MPPAAVLAQMSDALPWPLLLLRRDCVLVHANLAARQLLHRGQPLKLDAARRVQAVTAAQQADFAAAVQAPGPVVLRWPGAQPLPALPGHGGCSIMFRPLAGNGDALDGGAVLVLLEASSARHADLQAFAQLHRLSAAETRVLAHLSQGHSAGQTAAALGTRPATVRSQVASLRRKSGYATVAALLRGLAAMPPLATLHLVQPPRDSVGE